MVALDTLREGSDADDRDLEDQLNADAAKWFFSLLICSKVLCGPRQTGDATAHLSIKQFIPEKVFKRFVHDMCEGWVCQWGGAPSAHRTWKPPFGEPGALAKNVGPDYLKYEFKTVCSWSPCFKWQDLCVDARYDDHVLAPFSEGSVVHEPEIGQCEPLQERLVHFEDGFGSPLGLFIVYCLLQLIFE
jgi:hypothetical protein